MGTVGTMGRGAPAPGPRPDAPASRLTTRQLLALRGSAASVAATLVAALSHSWAGGALPSPLLIVGMAAVLVFPAMALMGARPRVRAGRIAVAVPVLQALFHAAFAALGGPVAAAEVVGHVHGGAGAWRVLAGTPAGVVIDPAMIAAHAAAAVVTIALLALGERAVLGVVRRASGWLRSRVAAVAPPQGRRPDLLADAPRVLRGLRGWGPHAPRGPPLPST